MTNIMNNRNNKIELNQFPTKFKEAFSALETTRRNVQKTLNLLQKAQKDNETSVQHFKQCLSSRKVKSLINTIAPKVKLPNDTFSPEVSKPEFFVVEMEDGTILIEDY